MAFTKLECVILDKILASGLLFFLMLLYNWIMGDFFLESLMVLE